MSERLHASSRLSREDFTRLVDRHQHRLHAYLAGLVGNEEQAFDLTQETFYEAWQTARRGAAPFLVGSAEVEAQRWLFRAASNNALSLLRRRKLIRWESLEQIEESLLGLHDTFEEHVVEGDALQAALAQLAPQDVACLLLRVVHGFSAAEAGSILNTSTDNVHTRLVRAKQRLRAAYFQRQSEDSPQQPQQSRRGREVRSNP